MKGWLGLFAALAASSAAAEVHDVRFYGYAFDLQTRAYLYVEVHHHRYAGDRWLGGRIRYVGADGRELGIMTLDFTADPYVPIYRLDLADGYAEGISAVDTAGVTAFRRGGAGQAIEQKHLAIARPTAADSGFHGFLCDHLEELARDKTVDFAFVAAGRLDSFRFRVRRLGNTTFEDRPAIELRAEPDSLLRWFVDPLQLVYDPATRRLLEYRGLSNIHDPASGKPWKVRIDYFTQTPPGIQNPPPLD